MVSLVVVPDLFFHFLFRFSLPIHLPDLSIDSPCCLEYHPPPLLELDLQQKKQDDAIQELQDFIADESNSNTKKMKAKIQLAGLESKDSLPLDRARINQGAAVRKQKKAEKVAKKAEAAAAYVVYTGNVIAAVDCF